MTVSSGVAPTSEIVHRRRREQTAEDEQEGSGRVVGVRRKKVTISLSEKSLRALVELRLATDADTDSEVFRNALRLHLALIRAHAAGVELFMKRNDKEEIVPVTLFAEVDGE
jgi:Ribbon-helix-helix protein, copG family